MIFNPGFDIEPTMNPMGFKYGSDVFGPQVENRYLKDIRKSLSDPLCDGPEIVYSIAMDVGKAKHKELLEQMHLLYGVVTYAAGRLGKEPIRSQGHIHWVSKYSGWSTPEVYEIWEGEAIIYMQEYAEDNPGRCFAVYAKAGDVVIVPPYWAHATISANPEHPLTFGAWCDREYGFEYDGVRSHKGIAWFPLFDKDGKIEWQANPCYQPSELICKAPADHPELGIVKGEAIYRTFERAPETFLYVPKPGLKESVWKNYEP
jgi:hypothetical protein